MVVTCSASTMEGSRLGQSDVSIKTCVGRYAFFFLEVIGTTVTVPECPFAVSLLTMNTGRQPSWTLVPGCFPSSANQMSPLTGAAPLCTMSVCGLDISFSGFFILREYADSFRLFFLPNPLTSHGACKRKSRKQDRSCSSFMFGGYPYPPPLGIINNTTVFGGNKIGGMSIISKEMLIKIIEMFTI